MIISLYAALLALMFVILTIRVIKIRRSQKVSLGDGGNLLLQRAIASQSNFSQSAPIFLILLLIAEAGGTNLIILHICGILFFFGRISHAYGISQEKENFRFRIGGMMATFGSIIILSLINLLLFFLVS